MSKILLMLLGVVSLTVIVYLAFQGQSPSEVPLEETAQSSKANIISAPEEQKKDSPTKLTGDTVYPQSTNAGQKRHQVQAPSPSPYLDISTWQDPQKPTVTEFIDSWWQRACKDDPTIEGCEDYKE